VNSPDLEELIPTDIRFRQFAADLFANSPSPFVKARQIYRLADTERSRTLPALLLSSHQIRPSISSSVYSLPHRSLRSISVHFFEGNLAIDGRADKNAVVLPVTTVTQ
jgi:hypothetical protein